MSSDAGYAAFLGRVQRDYSNPPPSNETPTAEKAATVAGIVNVNPAIRVPGKRYYVSETDEPFESVSFTWHKRTLPDKYEFWRLVGVQNGQEITQLEPSTWDSRGEYMDVVHDVTKATGGGGAVRVYRVEGAGSRVEYFVVGVDEGNGKLVGFKVLSVES